MDLVERYNAAAPVWRHMLESHGFPDAYRTLANHAQVEPAEYMIDVGAGSGAFSTAYYELRQQPRHHVLLDTANAMLEMALAAHPKARALCEDLSDHSPKQLYDLVLCAHVIEHCPDPAAALADLARITAPGGTVLLAVSKPHFCQLFIWLKWQHRWFSAAQVQNMAKATGLHLRETVPFAKGVPARVSQGYVFKKRA
jgi:ubiquinone/menaquinone biosynthesis C-methylase UbiE